MARQPFDPNKARGADAAETLPFAKAASRPFSVSELTDAVTAALEGAFPASLTVVGELSNFKRHSNGHLYFTLKDEGSELPCVMWRSSVGRLRFQPEDGMDLLVTGRVSVFKRGGRYQLYVRSMEPRGVGALEVAFRQMRAKLEAEGLFDPVRKRKLPAYPQRIGVITSATGAAIRDILNTLKRRYPCAEVVTCCVAVQGPKAKSEVAAAIRQVNRRSESLGGIDVLIVGRGGGSLEDLWAFNEEVVARAIFASEIPVISAVGHETDTTISDLVADVRAATPTAAAELAAPLLTDVLEELDYRRAAMARALRHALQLAQARVSGVAQRRFLADPKFLLRDANHRCRQAEMSLRHGAAQQTHAARRRIEAVRATLHRTRPSVLIEKGGRKLIGLRQRLFWLLGRRLGSAERELAVRGQKLAVGSPSVQCRRQGDHVADLERRLARAVQESVRHGRDAADRQGDRLAALSHHSVLKRGFSITRLKKSGRIVREADQVAEGDRLETQVADGKIVSRVVDGKQGELFG